MDTAEGFLKTKMDTPIGDIRYDSAGREGKTKLLLVDDEPFVLALLSEILQSHGFIACVAQNGIEAIQRIELDKGIDLVITDLSMPGIDGIELIRRLKAVVDIPVLVLSGTNEVSAAIEALKTGATDFLLKDGNLEEIVPIAIRNALEKSRVERLNIQLIEDLKCKNAQLNEAYADLKRSQERLIESEKIASLGRLVAGVAHEMNTPLGVALTASGMIQHMVQDLVTREAGDIAELEADLVQSCGLLAKNLRKAQDLVQRFKQLSCERDIDAPEELDISEVVTDCIGHLQPLFASKKIDVRLELAVENRSWCGHGRYLFQVLSLLLQNIVDHAYESSGGKTDIRIHPWRNDPNLYRIEIEDYGIGIPEDTLSTIFNPFVQVKRKKSRTGLGLTICHNIVTGILDGTVSCTSRVGEGTKFTLGIPRLPKR